MRDGNSGRDIGMMVGCVALGLIGGRLLPPFLAMAAGRIRGKATGDPFRKLENDHRLILATLRSMEETQGTGMAKRMALFLSLKRKLAKHALAEEDVVYPLLQNEAERRDAAQHLYQEHSEMKVLLYEIETSVMEGQPWTAPVSRLHTLVERHAAEEEREQFPKLRAVLTDARFAEIGALVHREEALIL